MSAASDTHQERLTKACERPIHHVSTSRNSSDDYVSFTLHHVDGTETHFIRVPAYLVMKAFELVSPDKSRSITS